MQQLQTDLRTLLDQAAKNDATLAAMRERLEKAESDRVPMEVVYGLAALVLLACGALAVLWSKRPRPVAWEGPQGRVSAAGMGTEHAAMPSSVGTTDIDVDLFGIDEEALAKRSPEQAAVRNKA
jgi:8-oxo-dGTP pyrophosphatase MutT (NUDIX family)